MKTILGIDVGGTKIAVGLVDNRFRAKQARVIPTSQVNLQGQLVDIIKSYSGFDAIGLALPGRILANGDVPRLPNIKSFKTPDIRARLAKQFRMDVHIMNDAKAFTLAEAILGAGKGAETVVGVTLGTGIGSGLVRNGEIYYGSNRVAGEIGRILVKEDLTLEQLMQRSGQYKNAKQAEPLIKMILSLIIRMIDPEVIVFGGGRVNHSWMQKLLNQSVKPLFSYPVKTRIRISKLKHAGVIGAALPLLKPIR